MTISLAESPKVVFPFIWRRFSTVLTEPLKMALPANVETPATLNVPPKVEIPVTLRLAKSPTESAVILL